MQILLWHLKVMETSLELTESNLELTEEILSVTQDSLISIFLLTRIEFKTSELDLTQMKLYYTHNR